ncbi:MAG TPA: DUF6132 family protein [Anaeromyxobacter sp.]|nr:DUF6132 family protein [Anaeromyxobacter sp.]
MTEAGPGTLRPAPAPPTAWDRFGRSWLRAAAAGLLGAAAGGAYAHFIGCRTGTCPLTSSVWRASLYGLAVGALIGWPVRRPDLTRTSR